MKLTTYKKLAANAYVISQYSKIDQSARIVGVYPTMEHAEKAMERQDEMWPQSINSITATTLYDAADLDLYTY
jgi:hypothetical protein